MKTIKRAFQFNLKKREVIFVKKIMASVMLPIFLLQMTSLNLVFANTAQAQAVEEAPVVADKPAEEPKSEPASELAKKEEIKSDLISLSQVEEESVVEKAVVEIPVIEEFVPVAIAPIVIENPVRTEESNDVLSASEPVVSSDVPTLIEQPADGAITPEADSTDPTSSPQTAYVEVSTDENISEMPKKEIWDVNGSQATTNDPVELGKTYVAPQNDQVTVTFTKLPENPGTLSIEEVELTDDQVVFLGALSNKAYDITSTMEDGGFKYDLVLPYPDKDNDGRVETLNKQEIDADEIKVKFSEDGENFNDVDIKDEVNKNTKTIEIFGLNHFTIFVPTVVVAGISWTSPNNIKGSDNVYAIGTYLGITAKGYGFDIPAGATIDGIVVNIERKRTKQFSSSTGIVYDSMAALVINGTYNPTTNRAVNWTQWSLNAEENKIFGSPTDKWGLNLTPADVNNPEFGFYLHPLFQPSNKGAIAQVDFIGIEIYYSLPSDTEPPVIASHEDVVAEATSSAGATVNYTVPTATDNVDSTVSVNCDPALGSTFPLGGATVTCNASDATGNPAIPVIFIVTVQDTTPPVISGTPADFTVEATSPTGATVIYVNPTAVDDVDGSIAVDCFPASGSVFSLGATTVNCSATDATLNSTTTSFIVTVEDTVNPFLTAYTISELIISPNASAGTKDTTSIDIAFSEQVSALIDIKDQLGDVVKNIYSSLAVTNPNPKIWDGKNSAGLFAADGIYTISVQGTDHGGNQVINKSQTVTVDNTAPIITLDPYTLTPTNADFTVNALTNEGTLNFISHTFTTNGSFDFVATDGAGNVTTETATVTNIDKEAPTVGTITIAPSTFLGGIFYISNLSTISAPVSDIVSGIDPDSCRYSITNGVSWVTPTTSAYDAINNQCVFSDVDTSVATGIAVSVNDNAGNWFDTTSSWLTDFTVNQSAFLDTDDDGVNDLIDSCPLNANPDQVDADNDGVGDVCDLCQNVADSTNQVDDDGDGIGNSCDSYNCIATGAEVCDDSDNDCDGFVDEGGICDTTAPVLFGTPSPFGLLSYNNANLSISFTDDIGFNTNGLNNLVSYKVDSVEQIVTNAGCVVIGGIGNTTFTFGCSIGALADGIHTLDFQVKDLAGNASLSENWTYQIDTTAPTLSANPPAGAYNSDQAVSLDGNDGGSGVENIYYTLDGSTPDETKTLYAGAITVDRDMTIKAIAYDNAGNASAVLEATYEIAPTISAETSSAVTATTATIIWTTDDLSTSRVVYDTVSHQVLGAMPNYGYANSTVEDATKVTAHSVGLTGLVSGMTYYYRTVSHGSPEAVGTEGSFATTAIVSSDDDNDDDDNDNNDKRRNKKKNSGSDNNGGIFLASNSFGNGAIEGDEQGDESNGGQENVQNGGNEFGQGEVKGEESGTEKRLDEGGGFLWNFLKWLIPAFLLIWILWWWIRRGR